MTSTPAIKKAPKRALYTFQWIEGGYNQVHATTKKEAMDLVIQRFSTLTMSLSTLKRLSDKQQNAYWKTFEVGGSRWTD